MPKDPHQLKEGDKVQWNWGGGAPSGTVKEVVTEGEAKVTTKRGNEVKKDASEENPAIKIDAGSSDAVKRANELRGVAP
ncbi:hypothetical protein BDZ90DRAFT_259597 [Jaminaea rosea]|uniref:Hypervirulence associated protein TUDOR domain-containing protein n=1 Tax=Jaminaea rosea TaxID=1569628 RepID=A0A316UW61_9BASI|nr:hypothetical protein BDZ90DRAFT_259597 [Jaminaea rosea]PWN28561.1 hypothetical protein BDZ90DRAFT_259597 [Jaminaea rosea]